MKLNYYRWTSLLFVFGILFCLMQYSGNANPIIDYQPSYEFNQEIPNTDSYIYNARNSIFLKSGFSYRADQTNNNFFIGKIYDYPIAEPIEYKQTPLSISRDLTENTFGTIPCYVSVLPNGSASALFDLSIPSVGYGITPLVRFVYNSNLKNGPEGYGWTINGLSSISIINQNELYDGKIDWEVDQAYYRLSLDGSRIYPLNNAASYWDVNNQYISNKNNEYRVYSVYSSTGVWYKVEYKDGTVAEYGRTSDSRLTTQNGSTIILYMNKKYDMNGNFVDYSYYNDNSEILIHTIKYLGNEKQNIDPKYTIEFNYRERKDRAVVYFDGAIINKSLLLEKINIYSGDLIYKSYLFEYLKRDYSMLHAVTEYGTDASTHYNSTIFNYQNTSSDDDNPLQVTSYPIKENPIELEEEDAVCSFLFGDFNGDGIQDKLGFERDYDSSPQGKDRAKVFLQKGKKCDLNANSAIDLFEDPVFVDYVYDSHLKNQEFNLILAMAIVKDFNRDGYDDLLLPYMQGHSDCFEGEDDDFEYLKFDIYSIKDDLTTLEKKTALPYKVPILNSHPSPCERLSGYNILVGDYDGDGYDEVLVTALLQYYNRLLGTCRLYKTESDRHMKFRLYDIIYDGKFNNTTGNPLLITDGKILPISNIGRGSLIYNYDIDGDKQLELLVVGKNTSNHKIATIYKYDNSLATFVPRLTNVNLECKKYLFGDFNGDGVADAAYINNNILYTCIWNGVKFLQPKSTNVSYYELINDNIINRHHFSLLYDANGDGIMDIVEYKKENGYTYTLFLNTGSEFLKYSKTLQNERGQNYDLNVLVNFQEYMITSPDGKYAVKIPMPDYLVPLIMVVNGNKIPMLYSWSGGGWLISLFPKDYGYKLTNVIDGLNNKTQIDYKNIALGDYDSVEPRDRTNTDNFYCKISNSINQAYPPNILYLSSSIDVVTSVSSNTFPESNISKKINYYYKGAMFHKWDYGFLGFEKIGESFIDSQDGYNYSEVTAVPQTDWYLVYPKESALYLNGVQLSSTKTEREIVIEDIVHKKARISKTTQTTDFRSNKTKVCEINEYDEWNNILTSNSTIMDYINGVDNPINEKEEKYSYINRYDGFWCHNNMLEWKFSKVTQRLSPHQSFSIKSNYEYYDADKGYKLLSESTNTLRDTVQVTKYDYDDLGRIIQASAYGIIDYLTTPQTGNKYITQYIYDSYKTQDITVIDPLGNSERNEYDMYGRVHVCINAFGEQVENEYTAMNKLHTVKEVTSGIEKHQEFGWANLNSIYPNAIGMLKYYGNTGDYNEIYFNSLLMEIGCKNISYASNDVIGKTTYSYNTYNKDQLLISGIPACASLTSPDYTINYKYDKYLRNIETEQLNHKNLMKLTQSVNYDDEKRQRTTTTPDGRHYTSIHNALGQDVMVLDPINNQVKYSYTVTGELNEISTVIGDSQNEYKRKYDYDWYGNNIKITEPQYIGDFQYSYDEMSRLVKEINIRGAETTLGYDKYGRIESQKNKHGNQENLFTVEYDDSKNYKGLIKKVLFGNNREINVEEYDSKYRATKITDKINSVVKTTEAVYDDQNHHGLIKHYKINDKLLAAYNYNNKGYLKNIENNYCDGYFWEVTQTDEFDNILQYVLGNQSIQTTYQYDQNDYLTSIVTQKDNHISIQEEEYNFDPLTSNLFARKDKRSNQFEKFQYDAADRLEFITDKDDQELLSMEYSLDGSIRKKSDIGEYQYEQINKSHAPKYLVLSTDYGYIAKSNDITYTSFNAIETVKNGDYLTKFYYGDNENRLYTELFYQEQLQSTKYYFGNYEVIKYESGDIAERQIYYIEGGEALSAALVIDVDRTGQSNEILYYLHFDHLGSLVAISNNKDDRIDRFSYDAWGRLRDAEDWSYIYKTERDIPAFNIFERGFTFHEHMPEYGLINMNGRVYDPAVGQFLQLDDNLSVSGDSQIYNKYSYVFNNPLNYTDPSGEFPVAFAIALMVAKATDSGIHAGVNHGLATGLEAFQTSLASSAANYLIAYGVGEVISVLPVLGTASPMIQDLSANFASNVALSALNGENILSGNLLLSTGLILLEYSSADFGSISRQNTDVGSAVAGAVNRDLNQCINRIREEMKAALKEIKSFSGGQAAVSGIGRDISTFGSETFQMVQNTPMYIIMNSPKYVQGAQNLYQNIVHPDFVGMRDRVNAEIASLDGKKLGYMATYVPVKLAWEGVKLLALRGATKYAEGIYEGSKAGSFIETVAKAADDIPRPVYCFIAGTMIATPSGPVEIQYLKAGDSVCTYNIESGQVEAAIIPNIFKRESQEFTKLYFASDSVICTLEHPFFVNNNWVAAKNLKSGDSLLSLSGEKVNIDSIFAFKTDTATAVYNLEAAGNHNYYVSATKVLVHNKELFNFSSTVAKHMTSPARRVPIQILEKAIQYGKKVPDPKGSRAFMYKIEMWKNNKLYNLEVLYDKTTNSIWHFQYNPIKR